MRRAVRLFLVLTLFIILAIWQFQGLHVILASLPDLETTFTTIHPVESAITAAEQEYVKLITGQSDTLVAATIRYRKRYGIEPPGNFDKWFALAQQHDFVLVDEFDTIMESIAPFRAIPPRQLRKLIQKALEAKPNQLLMYEIRNGKFSAELGTGNSWFADNMRSFLPMEWLSFVPDMTLAMNVLDEPQVVIPRPMLEQLMSLEAGTADVDVDHEEPFEDFGRNDPWQAISQGCSSRDVIEPVCQMPKDIQLVRNTTASQDICTQCNIHNQHGFLMLPDRLFLTTLPIPILSQAKPSVFNDILFPSPHYFGISSHEKPDETAWEKKHARLYWTGSATGGYATEQNWQDLHRQRLALKYKHGASNPIQLLEQDSSGIWLPYNATTADLDDILDIRITGITDQCALTTCTAESEAFNIDENSPKDPEDLVHTYKFLLDIDGNSFSGRFHRLLRTNAVVFKKSIFKEWWSDRLVPWVHYIPISSSSEELPEMIRYLARTEEGDGLARKIALNSRDWAEKALRRVDEQLVMLRLLLELGRLFQDEVP